MKRRQFITILLATSAGAALLAYGLHTHFFTVDSSFPELIELVPANSTFVAYVNLAELRKEPLILNLAALAAPVAVDRDYAEFISATGFDYRRDLDRVVFASRTGQTFAIADGRFDRTKIREYALRTGKVERQSDHDVYLMESKTPGQTISLAFLGRHRLAITEGGDIAPYLTTPAAPLDATMRQNLLRVAGSPAFAAWKIPDSPMGTMGGATPFSFTLPALQSLLGLDVAVKPEGEQMLISAEGECKNALEAQKLAAGLTFLQTVLPLGLANHSQKQISAENAALAVRLIHAAAINADGERVRLLLRVTPDMIRDIVSAN